MKLKEAFSRLGFTISKQNKPNQLDADAFNSLVDQFKKIEEKTVQENLLFAKLYAYVLGKMAGHYSDVDGAQKHLNKLLEQPFETTVKILEMELRAMEVRQVFNDEFLNDQSPKKLRETIIKYPKLKTEFNACWDYWDNENVKSHLKSNINLSIQNFKNHV